MNFLDKLNDWLDDLYYNIFDRYLNITIFIAIIAILTGIIIAIINN